MSKEEYFSFLMETKVIYGIGSAEQLGNIVAQKKAKRVMIIADSGVKKAGLVEKIQNILYTSHIESGLFEDIEISSSTDTVDKGATLVKQENYDLIVGIGGGSSIDTAKAIGVVVTNGGKCIDYAGNNKVKNPSMEVIALPTTAGTSAEITDVAVIADRKSKARIGIRSPYVVPSIAILDPLLTLTMPPHITASTGMDALSHAIESYTNTYTKAPTEVLALEAIRKIGANLCHAVANGNNLEARDNMLMGNLLAGLAFRNTRLGILHAITGPFCGYYEVPHGVANSVLLPYIMEYNLKGNFDKFVHIASALGISVSRLSRREAALASITAVRELLADIGLPLSFKEMNLDPKFIPEIASKAIKSANITINPRVPTVEDLIDICEKSFQ
ncbi:MAG: iron-containing alcohol dehydrogenase [Candidatus Caldatribacteriota bacterium]